MSAGHAKLAPSAAHRWFNCPGSVRASEPYPDTSSLAADEGTYAHTLAAIALRKKLDAVAFVGSVSDCGRFRVDGEFAEALQVYLDGVRCLELLHGPRFLEVEQKVQLVGVRNDITGTADAISVTTTRKRLDVLDLKFGSGVYVPVEDNEQALIYALGALLTFPNSMLHVEEIGLHIVQPRYYGDSVPKWRTIEVTPQELHAFGEVVKAKAEATEAPDAPLVPGDWCTFCPAKASCPALHALAVATAQHVFDPQPEGPPDPAQLTAAQVAVLLPKFALVEDWISAVRSHAYELASKGTPIPGHKIVEKFGNRKWLADDAARDALAAAGVDPFDTPKLISPAEAERRLGKARASLVAKLAAKPRTGTTLVPDSDARVAFSPGSLFD